jgi:hypothetical protein
MTTIYVLPLPGEGGVMDGWELAGLWMGIVALLAAVFVLINEGSHRRKRLREARALMRESAKRGNALPAIQRAITEADERARPRPRPRPTPSR